MTATEPALPLKQDKRHENPGRPRNTELRLKVGEMLLQGKSINSIAVECECSRNTVKLIRREIEGTSPEADW